jgi:peptidylprolyl isomerase
MGLRDHLTLVGKMPHPNLPHRMCKCSKAQNARELPPRFARERKTSRFLIPLPIAGGGLGWGHLNLAVSGEITALLSSPARIDMKIVLPCVLAALLATAASAQTPPGDYRTLDPQNLLYMDLEAGRVVIELAPQFAPNHVDNIRTLVREKYFDAQRITRSQDNFVVQWGDETIAKPLRKAKRTLPGEFTRSAVGLSFTALPDADTYAPQTGFSDGFPAARESATGQAWAVHCYGMVGVGRDNAADSGGGTELYVVTGHAPRQLDRNITLVGRVVQGMNLLSALPRGAGNMGIYATRAEHTVIKSIRVAADLPESERDALEAVRTDSQRFTEQVEARRNRRDEWYKVPAGRVDVCNVPLPVRKKQLRQ